MTSINSVHISYDSAKFILSAEKFSQCPSDSGGEVAFAGRSNAGKSSALNTLTRQKKLARISKTPGRTQLINFFGLNESNQLRLVDLPGYGYAKVPPEVKERWKKHLDEYLRCRDSLKGIVLVMDIRHPFQEFDLMMMEWASASKMPMHVLLTKADKLKKGPGQNTFLSVQKKLNDYDGLFTTQLFSSLKNTGIDQLKQILDNWLLRAEE